MKKSQNMLVWLNKWFWPKHFLHSFAEVGKRPAREECNKYDMTAPSF
jgi:hypothetical protein